MRFDLTAKGSKRAQITLRNYRESQRDDFIEHRVKPDVK
jgi:hypothetical protein